MVKLSAFISTLSLRPIHRLVPLAVWSHDVAPGPDDAAQPAIVKQQLHPASEQSEPVLSPPLHQELTCSGRVVRAPDRFSLV